MTSKSLIIFFKIQYILGSIITFLLQYIGTYLGKINSIIVQEFNETLKAQE